MGEVAIVTGAGSGLGRATALGLIEAGFAVAGVGRRQGPLAETGELAGGSGRYLALAADVTDATQVDAMVAAATEGLGSVTCLVNNAGGGASGWSLPLIELSDEQWHRGLDRNLTSAFLCSRAVLPGMVQEGRGRIINVASGWAFRGPRGEHVAYSVAKAGLVQLTRVIAMTYGSSGVRATCMVPGLFPHRLGADQRAALAERQPAGRVGEVGEIAAMAVFLASEDAEFLNGTALVSDGGALAGGMLPPGVLPMPTEV